MLIDANTHFSTHHFTLGFWEMMSRSRVSIRSLSSPPLSNLFASGSGASGLFWRRRRERSQFILEVPLPSTQRKPVWQVGELCLSKHRHRDIGYSGSGYSGLRSHGT